jgi:hypothetical protein
VVKATGKKMFIHGGRHRGSTRPENLRRSRSEISEFYTLTSRDFGSGAPPLTPIGKYLSVPFFQPQASTQVGQEFHLDAQLVVSSIVSFLIAMRSIVFSLLIFF